MNTDFKDTVSAVSFFINWDTVSQLGGSTMIKVKVTKNIMNKNTGFLNLSVSQMIAGLVGVAVGLGTFFWLKDYLDINGLMWIIMLEMILVIGFGIVKINDMSLFTVLIKSLKGVDKRPYSNKKGVFDDDDFSIF